MREIETRLEALESEDNELNEAMVTYAYDYKKLMELTARLEEIHLESDALYAEYEELI